jgi:hypothetical protein
LVPAAATDLPHSAPRDRFRRAEVGKSIEGWPRLPAPGARSDRRVHIDVPDAT